MFRRKKNDSTEDHLRETLAALASRSRLAPVFPSQDGLVEDIPVDFIFLIIEEPDSRKFASLCSEAIRIVTDEGADVTANAGGLLQIQVGPRTDLSDCTDKRIGIVSNIAMSLGRSVRIVHGRVLSRVGIVGTESRRNAGYYPIALMQVLSALLASNPGAPVDMGDLSKRSPDAAQRA